MIIVLLYSASWRQSSLLIVTHSLVYNDSGMVKKCGLPVVKSLFIGAGYGRCSLASQRLALAALSSLRDVFALVFSLRWVSLSWGLIWLFCWLPVDLALAALTSLSFSSRALILGLNVAMGPFRLETGGNGGATGFGQSQNPCAFPFGGNEAMAGPPSSAAKSNSICFSL